MITDDSQTTRNLVADSPAPWIKRLAPIVVALVLVVLTFIAFAPAVDNGFRVRSQRAVMQHHS
jgi:hypothetical protein